jgi:hypothetical protein
MKKIYYLSALVLPIAICCSKHKETASQAELILKSYKVNPSVANEINKGLNSLLEAKPIKANLNKEKGFEEKVINYVKSSGRSNLFSPEIIGVKTSLAIHEGIPKLIEQISKSQNSTQE